MSAVDTLAADILELTVRALATLPDAQRRAYELTHGIDAEGQTERGPLDNQTVATLLNVTRSTVRWNLAQAECNVFRAIARFLLDSEIERLSADEVPPPGPLVADLGNGGIRVKGNQSQGGDNLTIHGTRAGTGGTVLGEGSERHVREAKRATAKGRTEALIRAHRDYVGAIA